MIDFEEIRKAVAIEHNNLLSKDDPILMSVTVHELVFQRYVDILMEQNDAYRKAIDAALQKGIADAKITAGRVITEGSDYASEQINTAVQTALDEGMERIREEFAVKREEEKKDWLPRMTVENMFVAGMLIYVATSVTILLGLR